MTLLIVILDSLMIFTMFLCSVLSSMVYFGYPWSQKEISLFVSNSIQNTIFQPYWVILSILFLFATLFSLFLRRKRSMSSSDLIICLKQGNEVRISNKAMTEFIQTIIKSIEEIHFASIKIISNSNHSKIIIKMKLDTLEGSNCKELSERIREIVKSRIASDIGIEKSPLIQISYDKIVTLKQTSVDYVAVEEELGVTE